jgi:hypothetical protein
MIRFSKIARNCLVAALLALALPRAAFGCDPCGLHGAVQIPGVFNAMRTTGLRPAAVTVGVQEQLTTFSVTGENDLRTTESDLELIRTLSVTNFSLAYNASQQFAVQVNAPLLARSYDHFERFRKVRDTEVGFGDGSILGTYAPYTESWGDGRAFVGVVAGLKVPTGDSGSLKKVASSDEAPATERIQGRGLTLGTGSYDVPLGVTGYLRRGRLQLFSSAQYTFRGEGTADYRFANDCGWSLAPGWLFLLGEEESLAVSAVVSGEHKGSDHLSGELLPRTASDVIYLGPELFYALGATASLQLAVDLPLARDVGGAVVKPETRTRLAVSWSF